MKFEKSNKILISSHIFTGLQDQTISGAVVIRGNKIAAVIPEGNVSEWTDSETEIINLEEQMICPGFVDNHVFFTGYVWSHLGVDLSQASSQEEAVQMLAEVMNRKKTGIIAGHGLPLEVIDSGENTLQLLEQFGNRPVIAFAYDRSACLQNQAAKDKYGIPENGLCAELCWKLFDEYLHEEEFISHEYEDFSRLLAQKGVTSIKEIGFDNYSGFEKLLKQMDEEHKLKHRIHLVSQPVSRNLDISYGIECRREFQGNFIQFMGYNIMVDGEIASNNADVIEEYKNLPGSHGEQKIDYRELERKVLEADKNGFRCALHAEGDRAVRKSVDIFEKCREVNGLRDARHMIIDLEMVQKAELQRMSELGITACNYVQIMDCIGSNDDFYGPDCVGEEGIHNYWPYKRMISSGVHLCCGTDLPLTVPDIPLSAFLTVNRVFPDGRPSEGINRECALKVEDILRAWSVEGQYANFRENELGTIEAGKLADLAIFDTDLFETEPMKLADVKVTMTICDGQIVYRN